MECDVRSRRRRRWPWFRCRPWWTGVCQQRSLKINLPYLRSLLCSTGSNVSAKLPLTKNIWTLAPVETSQILSWKNLAPRKEPSLSIGGNQDEVNQSIKTIGEKARKLWVSQRWVCSIKLCNDQRAKHHLSHYRAQGRGELSNGCFRNSDGFQVCRTQRAARYFRAGLSARASIHSLSPFLKELNWKTVFFRPIILRQCDVFWRRMPTLIIGDHCNL